MGKRLVRTGTAVAAAVIGAFTGAGAGVASAGAVQSQLADVTGVSLAEVLSSDSAVVVDSVARALAEAGDVTLFTQFYKAPSDLAG